MLVAIPSKGRSTSASTMKVLPHATVYVPEIESDDYRKVWTNQIVGVPNDVRGITKTRNWILRSTKNRYVVFVDDDVQKHGFLDLGVYKTTPRSLTEEQYWVEWTKLFHLTEDMGYRVWGPDTSGDLMSVHPTRPFTWHTYLTASCMGMLNTGTYFDESFPVKEDYELGLRCLSEDGGIVGARYLYWRNAHWTTPGGCKDYRTQEMEEDAIQRLIHLYPGLIRRVNKGGSGYSIVLDF